MVFHVMIASVAALAARAVPTVTLSTSRSRAEPVVSAPSHAMDMQPAPINPDWIIAGDPQARMADHSKSADRAAYTALWDCTAGTFRWFFAWDETVHILEGGVHVTAEDGSVHHLNAGDVAYFKAGTWATWRVDTYVRKVAFLRRPFPAPIAFAYRLKNKLLPAKTPSL
ncbi:cupin domain-containing protein [Agrobacterium rubi]|uniref:Cupin domain-containing protein n=1 Tax=Agrobacterium rubi TaxID=28099 RepID=A0AAE7RAV6_9HYPH|nr:cupin domain-containing protein [Agrobacterium rubi]NTE85244.1 cupin domain-containing protein [Agrobacterium rubi]NTF01176.1 cupin domain-containing protein [Agrobacterium rubi]NTF35364.1 cupin domain-containing protein [Agrobacterium rubi]OCJ48625.1 cupin [Agrobacterium rubi]QTG00559.1 cupin domain-containing protein [Agrobacterium rubi]